jgi:hypothetical protein
MQDKYAGDVGDFGKLGLLRWLCGIYPAADPELRLGIVWYLVPDELKTNDGKHIGYTNRNHPREALFRSCDPDLYDELARMLDAGQRSVARLQTLKALPRSARHFLAPLDFRGMARGSRPDTRSEWLNRALEETRDCDLVFIDPDNGLETKSVSRLPKYAYFDDLEPFVQRGQSLVIYQHVNRTASAFVQAQLRINQIQNQVGAECLPAVRFRRGTGRLYLVVPAARHMELLRRRTATLLESSWGRQRHFELISQT